MAVAAMGLKTLWFVAVIYDDQFFLIKTNIKVNPFNWKLRICASGFITLHSYMCIYYDPFGALHFIMSIQWINYPVLIN